MSAVAAAIAVMRAKGIDPADILDVVEAIVSAAPAAPVRSAGADRQARYRQRQSVTSDVTRDVTRDVTPPSLKDVVPKLTTVQGNQNPPPYSPPAPKNSRGSRIAADAVLSERNRADALRIGVPADKLDGVWQRHRDFWTAKAGKDAVKLDWDATWRNWCSSECDRKGWAPSSPSQTGADPPNGIKISPITDPEAWEAWRDSRGGKPLPTDRDGNWTVATRFPTPTPQSERSAA